MFSFCDIHDSLDDLCIAGASTNIAAYGQAYILLRRCGVLAQQSVRRHQHARCAKATLDCAVIDECLL